MFVSSLFYLLFFFFHFNFVLAKLGKRGKIDKGRIYTVRAVASRVFEYRISRAQKYLDGLNQQRDETIEKLKVATKYNSTQQLLEKYGGESISGSPRGSSKGSPGGSQGKNKNGGGNVGEEKKKQQQQPGRTGIPPPPTANIRRPEMSPFASSSAALASVAAAGRQSPRSDEAYLQGKPLPLPPQQHLPYLDEPGFAPNAFPSSHSQMQTQSQSQPQSQYAAMSGGTPKWYDRLMDVLLGEDETLAKNRLVLICQRCRLVNGQAPPGVKSLSELGRWRCGSCGAWNGEESEAKKVIASVAQEIAEEVVAGESVVQAEEHSPNQLAQEEKEADANEDIQPIDEKLGTTQSDIQPRQTRSRAKNSKNSKN